MADTYSNADVQRAVKEATREIHDDVKRILANTGLIDDIHLRTQRLDEIYREWPNLLNSFEEVRRNAQTIAMSLSNRTQGGVTAMTDMQMRSQQLATDMQKLSIRIGAMEQYLRELSLYFAAKRETEEEDKQYRRA